MKSRPQNSEPRKLRSQRVRRWLPRATLILAGLLCYSNSFGGPFVFDGERWIVENPAIRQLWPPTSSGIDAMRPVGYWTFAVNYAVSGLDVRGFHFTNLAIHLAAGLTLYGVI